VHHSNFLRPASTIAQNVSLAHRRVIHVQRVAALRDLISVWAEQQCGHGILHLP
jgi:hypothetical protein